jgi:hypothetical protein
MSSRPWCPSPPSPDIETLNRPIELSDDNLSIRQRCQTNDISPRSIRFLAHIPDLLLLYRLGSFSIPGR